MKLSVNIMNISINYLFIFFTINHALDSTTLLGVSGVGGVKSEDSRNICWLTN